VEGRATSDRRTAIAETEWLLDEEVEGEEEEAEDKEEGAPGETAAGELRYGMKKADGDDAETGFAAALVEGSGGNVAREIAAEGGEFIVHPESELCAVAPEEKRAKNRREITEAG
jgi:hypothetical protein